jgi:D-arabinose 1-dehydrogenase-like Zn-dependent alcohol dehydrogenase
MAPPQEIKAVIITQRGTAEVKTVPLPTLPDDHILVRTTAVGLNPTDWMHIHQYEGTEGTRSGCDYAGVVEQVGPSVTKPFVKGDRICGFVHGANRLQPERGTFGEYIIVKGDLQIKIPDNLTDEEAASLGVGVTTVVCPLPPPPNQAHNLNQANQPPFHPPQRHKASTKPSNSLSPKPPPPPPRPPPPTPLPKS